MADADIEAVVGTIFATAFINNGQTCVALKRLYVHDEEQFEPILLINKSGLKEFTLIQTMQTSKS